MEPRTRMARRYLDFEECTGDCVGADWVDLPMPETRRGTIAAIEAEAISAYKAELRERIADLSNEREKDNRVSGWYFDALNDVAALLDSPDQPDPIRASRSIAGFGGPSADLGSTNG